MNIVFAARHDMDYVSGGLVWVTVLTAELKRLGHTVSYCSAREFNIPKDTDAVIGLHCAMNIRIRDIYRGLLVDVTHGVIHDFDGPAPNCDVYLAVSEESQALVGECSILRNPIDTERFENVGCGKTCKTIAVSSRRRLLPFIKKLRRKYIVHSLYGHPVPDVQNFIRSADLVIATGRGCYEAMSMGKNVIVSGCNSSQSKHEIMDGFVNEESFLKFRENNCSGRYTNKRVVSFDSEISKYSQEQGQINAQLIRKYNDSTKIAKELLSILEGTL